ncbi:regulator of chromosome condensation 1/beta-lactamase-inhibitor protein II [Roridomyces roridus]|uniref:Regulator of chromosome condensation 1/beta-lactamase-inhibitor protein II n=1 Tax=Roridomyces roridus TaxID=1738132 RepID=A0AAD7FJF6_9AGAR|nr:regulator of chromosome condensation 1/beta-lactamase-inhibitor protein II [Roridomyces roridus]
MSASAIAEPASDAVEWGRVLICGGTDWPRLGKKGAKPEGSEDDTPDLLEPHILRALSNVKSTFIASAAHACHCVVLDIDGVAWLFGRNGSCALGVPSTVDSISENAPRKLTAQELGVPPQTKFVYAACGRNHTLLIGSDGTLWSAGANTFGQCGQPVSPDVPTFKAVSVVSEAGVKEHVVKATAGITFSAILTDTGKVYTFGSGEKGQLGNGRTGERIVTGNKVAFDSISDPVQVDGLDNKKIVQISAGQQHCIALESTGLVYVWGYGGYCRLGLGNQADELRPKLVPNFAGPNEQLMGALVAAGPSNSVVVDRQGMYWMTGKWKNSGEGSSGSPYSSFRYMQDIMACKVSKASCGGVTHWMLTPDDEAPESGDAVMTVAWGQNAANGELGLGPDEPKSATKPTKHVPLTGVTVLDIAPGQNTTLFLAKPVGKYADLPRHPMEVGPTPETCIVCGEDHGEDVDDVLECEKCDAPYHLGCLTPPLDSIPEGEWFCADCEESPGASVGAASKKLQARSLKRKADSQGSGPRKKRQ